PRATWNRKSESILLDSLKESKAAGLGGDNNFQPGAFQAVVNRLTEAGYRFDVSQVKSRWNRFKKAHGIVKHLRSLSGFGWDDTKKIVTAEPDVWKGLLYK
ncbi:hypothetical protein PENSPDRAFT_539760, partial [Peniophora sp. CONT]